MPQDILEYFSYDINCPLWDTYDDRWWDPWCLAGFLGEDKFDYGATTTAVKTEEERSRPRGSSSWDGLALHREPHDDGPQRTAMVAMGPRVINPGAGPPNVAMGSVACMYPRPFGGSYTTKGLVASVRRSDQRQ
jgi:hypothetical protein